MKPNNKTSKTAANHTIEATETVTAAQEFPTVPMSLTDISPLNYRKFYDPEALDAFANQLKAHGIISPVTVRKMPTGRYELVAGERRYRAAFIAAFTEIPAVIRELTDQQVREIQLAENLQRENPHPMHEAQAIFQLEQSGLSMEEISVRLGKSKSFVYTRIKLNSLKEEIQDMFLASKVSIQDALEIAALSELSQQEFFDDHCQDWQNKKFRLHNLAHTLDHYRYDLTRASFDIKDKKLVPDAGACNKCPSNSATLKSLFPDMAKQAICSNRECYQLKCTTSLSMQLFAALAAHTPTVILTYSMSDRIREFLKQLEQTKDMPMLSFYSVDIVSAPEAPDPESYREADGDDEEILSSVDDARQEYEQDLSEFQTMLENGTVKQALKISDSKVEVVFFREYGSRNSNQQTTAKEVQEAIKEGTATPELLQREIDRIENREVRSKEIDKEYITKNTHEKFCERLGDHGSSELTQADQIAARLIVYQSLNYNNRYAVDHALFSECGKDTEDFFQRLATLSEAEYSTLIRYALSGKAESKIAGHITAFSLYHVANESGVDVALIEAEQAEKAAKRRARLDERIDVLNHRKTKMETAATAA